MNVSGLDPCKVEPSRSAHLGKCGSRKQKARLLRVSIFTHGSRQEEYC